MTPEFEQIKELLIAFRKKHNCDKVYCSINDSVISISGYDKDNRYRPKVYENVFWCDKPENEQELCENS